VRLKFSASMLGEWCSCPLKAKYKRIDHLPDPVNARAVFGSIVHQSLEHWHTHGDLQQALRIFEVVWADPSKIGLQIGIFGPYDNWAELNAKGSHVIAQYVEKRSWERIEHIASEFEFCVPLGPYDLHGFVDELEFHRNAARQKTLVVLDLKTGKPPTKTALRLNLQMSAYLYAVSQREFWTGCPERGIPGHPMGEVAWESVRDLPRRAIWMDLNDGRELDAGDRTDEDFGRLLRACQEIERAIRYQVYVPNVGTTCHYCPYGGPDGPCPVSLKPSAVPEDVPF
jgi:PD-(D/E)XK nuclease superfamily protein